MLYFDVIEAQFWPIVIATVVSTVLVLVVTGWVHQLVRKSNGIFNQDLYVIFKKTLSVESGNNK